MKEIPDIHLIMLYQEKQLSTREIAQQFGVDKSTITTRLRRLGIPIRPHGDQRRIASGKAAVTDAEIAKLYMDEDMAANAVAKRLGASPTLVIKRLIKMGIYRPNEHRQGPRSPNWRGGRIKDKAGYVRVYAPGRWPNQRYHLEHVHVWEQMHGRALPKGWVVHHLNGIKDDNRPQNLAALPNNKHIHLIGALKARIQELEGEIIRLKEATGCKENAG